MSEMEKHIPVIIKHVQLQSVGTNTRMQSDKFLSFYDVKENQVVVVDFADPHRPIHLHLPIDAWVGIVHPEGKIIAVVGKYGKTLTIFNMETNIEMKVHNLNKDISAWNWISTNTIGLVTLKSVYHWSMDGRCSPVKMFNRHSSMSGSEFMISNYVVDASETWLLLAGNSNMLKFNSIQLYSVERKVSQIFTGYQAVFCQFKMRGNFEMTNLLCFVGYHDNATKLHIMEVGCFPNFNQPFPKKIVTISLTKDYNGEMDMVIGMQASHKYGIIFLITLHGYIHLYDIESAQCMYVSRICDELKWQEYFFDTAAYEQSEGIIAVNKKGQVISVRISEQNLLPYLISIKGNAELATRIARRCNLPGADNLHVQGSNQKNGVNQGEGGKISAVSSIDPFSVTMKQDGRISTQLTKQCNRENSQENTRTNNISNHSLRKKVDTNISSTSNSNYPDRKRADNVNNEVTSLCECPICLEIFHNPKSLNCEHHFCKDCLEEILQFNEESIPYIKCPMCSSIHQLESKESTVDSIKCQLFLKQVLDTLHGDVNTTKDTPKCCEKPVCWYCGDCDTYTCEECIKKHEGGGCKNYTYAHYCRSKEVMFPFCKRHRSFKCYGCKTCAKVVCPYCKQKDHKLHTITSFNEYTDIFKGYLVKRINSTKKYNNQVNTMLVDATNQDVTKVIEERAKIMREKCVSFVDSLEHKLKEEASKLKELELEKWKKKLQTNGEIVEKAEALSNKGNVDTVWGASKILQMMPDCSITHEAIVQTGGGNDEQYYNNIFTSMCEVFQGITVPCMDESGDIHGRNINVEDQLLP